jgi:hypothetical protein
MNIVLNNLEMVASPGTFSKNPHRLPDGFKKNPALLSQRR